MRKVGIITLPGLDNYGNRLQVYALSKVLNKLGCEAVEVRYFKKIILILKEIIKKNKLLLNLFLFFCKILKGVKFSCAVKECIRVSLFASFAKKTKRKILTSDSLDFDYFVCGSDQIWNPKFAGDACYFAAFAAKEKRISYAASFGVSTLPKEVVVKYKNYLEDMQHISVREHAGAEIVKQLTGKDACVLIDPTLMLDKKDWKNVSRKPKFNIQGKYILTYFLSKFTNETDEYIKRIAKENNLQIISLLQFKQSDYWYFTGPSEFVWLIENASLVCTDSFHASVFSVLMDSPFIVFRRNDKTNVMHSRLESLLSILNLTDRFFENIKKEDDIFKKNYLHIPDVLNLEREKANNFLINVLKLNDKRNVNDKN